MTGVEQEKSLHATDQVQADRGSLFTVVSTKSGVMALRIIRFPLHVGQGNLHSVHLN